MRNIARQVFKYLPLDLILATLLMAPLATAQQQGNVVPTLVNFSGTLVDVNGKPLSGMAGVSFYLYKDQQGGAPLWIETQNIQPDKFGHYTVTLGATKSQGLPTDLFASGEARWLGIQAEGQAEQPRVMLLAVPYALKAGDAQTVGGLPPSAFVLAAVLAAPASSSSGNTDVAGSNAGTTAGVTGSGTTDYIPLWTGNSILGSSVLFQSGSGSTAMLGLNETSPLASLDINGSELVRGLFESATTGNANASKGFNSNATDFEASSFNSGTKKAVLQHFEWQAEPTGNNTSTPGATLNLLFGSGTNTPGETGLKLSNTGLFTFASGQTFPGTGTITGVTAGTDLTGGGASGNVTLNLDTTKVPQLIAANTFTGNQSITGNLSTTGSFTGQTASFSANNSTQVVSVAQSGTGNAAIFSANTNTPVVSVTQSGSLGTAITGNIATEGGSPAILGNATNTNLNGSAVGVEGNLANGGGYGVFGYATNSNTGAIGVGVAGETQSPGGIGVYGQAVSNSSGATAVGVQAYSDAPNGVAALGQWRGASARGVGSTEIGVWGDSSQGIGVVGSSDNEVGTIGESGSDVGVFGFSLSSDGVQGSSAGSGRGVDGISVSGAGVEGKSDTGPGVYGTSDGVAGVNGIFNDPSVEGAGFANVGMWGDTGVSGSIALVGTADDGNALFGKNNTTNHETLYVENDSSAVGASAARFAGPGSGTYCYIDRDSSGLGDIVCTGAKSAAVAVDGNRMVRLYAVEAADNWFEDAGSGQLTKGFAAIRFESTFSQTINSSVEYHVFLTPKGDCQGLYVSNENAEGFEVHELHGGHSNIAFDYRIMARRKGFENVRMQDVSADFERMKAESDAQAARQEAGKQAAKARPVRHIPVLPNRSPSSSPQAAPHPHIAGLAQPILKTK